MTRDRSLVATVKSPCECQIEDLNAFEQVVLAGGEVNRNTLSSLITRALSLVFVRVGNQLVAVGAIKRPNAGYRASVFGKAGVKRDPTLFEFELGWVYIDPTERGIGLANSIVEILVLSLHGACAYATSRVDNERMHAVLKRFEFQPLGNPYPSQLNEPEIQLFIRG